MPLVARDKKGRAARRATRNARGEFTKTTRPVIDFFAFPPEVRAIIYTFHFAYERPNGTTRTIWEPKSSIKSKLALLRTSKATRAEAKPIFYRNHIFHIPIPTETMGCRLGGPREIISSSLARPNALITSIQLTDLLLKSVATRYYSLNLDYASLRTFLQHLPSLKFLRLGVRAPYSTDHSLVRWDSPICRILAELWQRLTRLEVYMLIPTDLLHLQFRVAIAPYSQWILESSGAAGSRPGFFWYVWALQRPHRLPSVT